MGPIEVTDIDVRSSLNALAERVDNLGPCLNEIGKDIADSAEQRFATSTGPDGQPWKANAAATINAYIASKNGFGKKGLTKKGLALQAGKKPLIATRGLSLSIRYQIINGGQGVEIGTNRFSEMIPGGAAIHQFGGRAGRGKKVTIPARPFLPIKQNGEMYPADLTMVLATINSYLSGK